MIFEPSEKSWVHHYIPESKLPRMEWCASNEDSPVKAYESLQFCGDSKGIVYVDFLHGQRIG